MDNALCPVSLSHVDCCYAEETNNLTSEPAGTACDTGASMLALCYSVAEYCSPVSLTPNSTTSCAGFQSACTPIHAPQLPVLTCHKLATGNMLQHRSPFKLACGWPSRHWHSTCSDDTRRHNYSVERRLAVGFCGQPQHCNWPHDQTVRWQPISSHMVSVILFYWRLVSSKATQMAAGQLPVNVANSRPRSISDTYPLTNLKVVCNYSTMWQTKHISQRSETSL